MRDNIVLTSSSASIQLCTVDQCLLEEGTTASEFEASITGMLQDKVNSISARFNRKANRYIRPVQVAGVYSGNGQNYLFLRETPIISIVSVEYRANESAAWQVITNTATVVDQLKLVLKDYTFESGNSNYRINYIAGYQDYSEFYELCKTMVRIAIRETNNVGNLSDNRLGNSSRQADAVSSFSTTFKDLNDRENELIQSIKKHVALKF